MAMLAIAIQGEIIGLIDVSLFNVKDKDPALLNNDNFSLALCCIESRHVNTRKATDPHLPGNVRYQERPSIGPVTEGPEVLL